MEATERFWAKVDKTALCWDWTADKRAGYGRFWHEHRLVTAHRFAYEVEVGPIPDGLTIDHLCGNKACVNPAHLDVVPHAVNVLRGDGPTSRNAKKTRCPWTSLR